MATVPLVYLVIRTVGGALDDGGDAVRQTLTRPGTTELLVTSAALTAAVTVTCLALGVASAWLLVRTDVPMRGSLLVLSALPLAVPSYVAAFGWIATVPGWSGFLPAWLVLSAVSTPYVTLPVVAALRSADPALEEVARSLGSSPWRAWRTGTLPQVAPAAAAGALLAALYTLSDFGAVAMLRLPVFTYAISRQYSSFVGREVAVVLALVLVVGALLLVGLERAVRGRGERWRTGSGARRLAAPVRLGRATIPAVLLLLLAPAAAAAVPAVALGRRLLAGTGRRLDLGDLTSAVISTAAVASAGALLTSVLALAIGILTARHRGALVAGIEAAGFTGHALPGLVVALSLVFMSLNVVPGLYQTTTLLMLAYAVLFLPKAIGATRTSIAQVPPVLAQTARSLGRGPVAAQAATTWRLAGPGIGAGSLLVMLTAMKELPATLLLRPTGLDTLATEIWSRTNSAAFGAAAPYAVALVLLAAVPAFLLTRPQAWGESGGSR
ncbi:MAG: iron ABC transporter permease [Nocardioides sp.]|nr:iron ABC transporter permease [Nocardioides sp.]